MTQRTIIIAAPRMKPARRVNRHRVAAAARDMSDCYPHKASHTLRCRRMRVCNAALIAGRRACAELPIIITTPCP